MIIQQITRNSHDMNQILLCISTNDIHLPKEEMICMLKNIGELNLDLFDILYNDG